MIGRVVALAAAGLIALGGCQLVSRTVTIPMDSPITSCLTFQLVHPGGAPMRDGDVEGAATVIEARLAGLGVAGATVSPGPVGTIVVGLPDGDRVRWLRTIEQVGDLVFVPVPPEFNMTVEDGKPLPDGMDATPIFDATGITSASVSEDQLGKPAISLTLEPEAADLFDAYAGAHFGERFAMVLDGIVLSAPSINATRFDGQAQISGNFTEQEAEDIAIALASGRLPAAVEETGSADPLGGGC